jgi:hypothetical protein
MSIMMRIEKRREIMHAPRRYVWTDQWGEFSTEVLEKRKEDGQKGWAKKGAGCLCSKAHAKDDV